MNPFHFFTRAAAEQLERNLTQFLVNNPLFQSFAHHSSQKAKEVASKVGEDIFKAAAQGAKAEASAAAKKVLGNMRK